ncbi:MAG: hypothetical protein AB7I48_16405 [Planctomycetaceae bacterium]
MAVLTDCPCPPGQQPLYDYPAPPSQHYLPAPTQPKSTTEPAPGSSQSLPDAPPSPSSPSDSQRPSDNAPQQPQTPDFNTQPPDMATPTFTPSATPTTAATSAQALAPNMIGDLFGTSYSGAVPVVIDNFYGFGSLTDIGGAPDFDITSPLSYSATNMGSTLYIGRTTDPMDALVTMPMFTLTGTTTASQSAIAAADPTLTGPVGIVNNTSVQDEVAILGASLHGPGGAAFVAADSYMELDPSLPIVPPLVTVSPEGFWNYDYIILSEAAGLSNPGAAPGAMVGRQKLTENTSPLPHDRVFVNYSYFNNTPLVSGGVNVNRVTPGFEKTFFGGNASVEVRAPFATTLDSDVTLGGLTDTSNAEFGNLTVYFKTLLWDAGYEAISAGLGLTFPTADDVTVRTAAGTPLLDIQNESIHVLPFIAGLYMPTERVFVQSILQLDIDPSGNSMRFTEFANGVPNGNLLPVGRPHDADYVFFDINIGYWAYQAPLAGACCDPCSSPGYGCGFIRGIAPMLELHYNGTFNDADSITAQRGPSTIRIGDSTRNGIDLWNVVLGATIECRHNANLTIGYAAPLNSGQDEQFNSELRVVFNWFFGGPDRVHSCCF